MSIDEQLGRYLAERDQQRADARLDSLSHRERRLVAEAAVMGYVQGVRAVPGGHRQEIPADSDVVALVVASCQSFSDLYPLLGGNLRDVLVALVDRWRLTDRAQIMAGAAALAGVEPEAVAEALRGLADDEVLTDDGTTIGRAT